MDLDLAPPPEARPARAAAGTSSALAGKWLYFGNLPESERQYASGRFVGLALTPVHSREIRHDAREPLPVPDGSVEKIQSQDVFEHLEYESLPAVFDDIHRALAPSGVFRLSLPDYHSPFVLTRCAFDENGEVIADLRMGGSVRYNRTTKKRVAEFKPDGGAHLWFPTRQKVEALIARSALRRCRAIAFHQCFLNRTEYVAGDFPELDMFVKRAPPNDMRAGGKPISIVVDFVK